jgi:hypothetical protein
MTPNKSLSIFLVLMLSISALIAFAPTVLAPEIPIETHAYIMLSPNNIGVGQIALITYRIDKVAAGATIRAGLFNGTTVTITKPDGTTETRGPLAMDSTSAGYFQYTPTATGTYYFQTNFPAQWVNSTSQGITTSRLYIASTSSKVPLTVTQDPVPSYPNNPLPDSYWTRPINAENKGWWQVADNWLMVGYDFTSRPFYWGTVFAPYTPGPESPHILWNQPIWFGGMVGGGFGDKVYYTGLSYEQYYTPLILNGRIIYLEHGPTGTTTFGTRCIDLYTGKEIWYLNNTAITYAQTLDIETGNEHGLLPYLWSISGQNWLMYDAFTARQILNVTGMPTGGFTKFGPNGEVLVYVLNSVQNTLTMWNLTRAVGGPVFDTWSPAYGSTINASRPLSSTPATANQLGNLSNSIFMGVEWNVTIPDVPGNQAICAIGDGYLLAEFRDASGFPQIYEDMAYNIDIIKKDQATGAYPTSISHAWIANRTDIYSAYYRAPWNIDSGVYALFDEGKMRSHGYDIKTGRELWATEPLTSGWGIFTYQVHLAYGRYYTAGFDGYLRAYDSSNGKLIWSYYFGDAGYETPYGTYPTYNGFTIADHKIYLTNDEHSPDSVMWRGGKLWCINADTGQQIWNISGWMRMPVIADGILTSLNVLDGQVYTIGKGPTKTTVAAPQTAIIKGSSLMITGTVTDQSPGKPGIACVSDSSMTAWMEYTYLQKPKPANATGVQVLLTATDPNGNQQTIGTATTDANSNYGIMWKPPVEGVYKITATFSGTKSYYNSEATTYLGVEAASSEPTSTPPPTTQPTSTPASTPTATVSPSPVPNTGSALGAEVYIAAAAVVVIAIVVSAALVLRKRK